MTQTAIEKKGLGAKLGDINMFGVGGSYNKYAALIQDDETNNWNILIMDDPRAEDIDSFPFIREGTYIFSEMVAEERARRKYEDLK